MHTLAKFYNESQSVADYVGKYCSRMSELLAALDTAAVEQIMEYIDRASREDRAVFFIANGGSAAIASHWVNDLVAGSYVEGQPPFRAYALADNVASVTALGNDAGFVHIFEHQLRVDMRPGDVVLAMSVSGNSENIIRAVQYAHANGAKTIGVCGFDGGRLKGMCDVTLHIPTTADEYGPVEDIFGVVDHLVTGYLTMKRGKYLHH